MDKFTDLLLNYTEAEDISDASQFKKDLGLASFDTVCLIQDIKKTMDIECTPGDFVKFNTVGEFKKNVLGI